MSSPSRPPTIAWIVPCYNEEVAVGGVVASIRRACPQGVVYVYDNASSDRTAVVAAAAGAVVRTVARRGKGNVVRRMFQDVEADVVIMVDGDSTYDVSQWRRLAEPILAGVADMSVACRLGHHDGAAFRSLHLFGNRILLSVVNRLFAMELRDLLSGYRAFSRRFVKTVALQSFGFEIETELTLKAIEQRFAIVEVDLPYGHRPAGSVSKLRTFEDGVIILSTIIRFFRDQKPLTLFGVLALAALALAGLIAAQGWPIAGGLLVTLAAIALATGLVLNAVAERAKELTQVLAKLALPFPGATAAPGDLAPSRVGDPRISA